MCINTYTRTYVSKIIIGDNLRRHPVQHTYDRFIFDRKLYESREVVYVDPREVLLAAADAAAHPEEEREEHILDHTSPATQHSSRTNYYLLVDNNSVYL